MSYVKTKQAANFTQAAAVTLADSAAETTLVSSTGTGALSIMKDSFAVGKTFRITAMGIYSNTGTPTLQLKVKLGAVTVLDSGAITTVTGASNRVFTLEGVITVYALGATGTVRGQGTITETGGTTKVYGMATTAAGDVPTTANQALNITATWGAASASNTITLTNLIFEELN